MKRIAYLSITILALVTGACYQDAEQVQVIEIGVEEEEYIVSQQQSSFSIPVFANGAFTATLGSDADWAYFTDQAADRSIHRTGDCEIAVTCTTNTALDRSTELLITSGDRSVKVHILQFGPYNGDLRCPDANLLVEWEGRTHLAKVLTLIPRERISIEIEYENEQQGWITDTDLVNNYLSFTTSDNTGTVQRSATIHLSATDEWGEQSTAQIRINQGTQEDAAQTVTFADLRSLLTGNGSLTIEEPLRLEGDVVNDNSEMNGAQVVNLTVARIDTESSARTAFIQSTDGSYGIRVLFGQAADNTLRRYDRVLLNLQGTTLTREGGSGDEPIRYTLSGLSEGNILSSQAGTRGTVTIKRKTIAQLTDEDLYTAVTLTDCEIPMRKGPFAPVCNSYNNFMGIFPMVIRDRAGSTMYMVNNVLCDFARNGEPIPYGSGDITGTIVYERCDQFEWDISRFNELISNGYLSVQIFDIGHLGRYQIRPTSRNDIDLDPDFQNGFSEIICEFRYFNAEHDQIVRNVDDNGHLWATYSAFTVGEGFQSKNPIGTANGEMWHTDDTHAIMPSNDWSYLGPVEEDGTFSILTNGNGVVDANGNPAHFQQTGSIALNGTVDTPNGSAWKHLYWSVDGQYQAWVVRFSTAQIDESHSPMSVQVSAVCCNSLSFGAPRYWVAQYSTDGTRWHEIAQYDIPDLVMANNRKMWQTAAFKDMSFTLDRQADVWNRENVYIRLIPRSSIAGSSEAYEGQTIVANRESCLNYFAVRCNK